MSGDIDEYIDQYEEFPLDDFDSKFYNLYMEENLYELVINYVKDNYDKIFY